MIGWDSAQRRERETPQDSTQPQFTYALIEGGDMDTMQARIDEYTNAGVGWRVHSIKADAHQGQYGTYFEYWVLLERQS